MLRKHTIHWMWLPFLVGLVPCAQAVSTYTCTEYPIGNLDTPVPTLYSATANNGSQVITLWTPFAQPGNYFGSFNDTEGVAIPYASPASGIPDAVNNLGWVAGFSPIGPGNTGFISKPDGSYDTFEAPTNAVTQSVQGMQVNSFNDNDEILGQVNVADSDEKALTYWYIRDATGKYTLFDPVSQSSSDFRTTFNSGSINNSGTAVLGDRIRAANGSEEPLLYRGSLVNISDGSGGHFDEAATLSGINNNGILAGFGAGGAFIMTPDGNAPAVACPNSSMDFSQKAVGINDKGVVVGASSLSRTLAAVVLATPTGFHSQLKLTSGSWGFSPTPVGKFGGSGLLFLTSTGKADLHIQSILEGARDGRDSSDDYKIIHNTCLGPDQYNHSGPGTLAPGEFCSIRFSFSPGGVGARRAQIVIYDDAPDAPHVIRLDGTGMGKGDLVLSNHFYGLASHPVGQTSGPGVIYIHNPGTEPIDFSSIAISGVNSTDFQITKDNCGATLRPYATCAVTFYLTPSGTGRRTANLTLTDDSPTSPQVIPIWGFGY